MSNLEVKDRWRQNSVVPRASRPFAWQLKIRILTKVRFIRKLAKNKDLSDRSAITLLTAKISRTKTAPLYIDKLCCVVSSLGLPN